MQPWVAEVDVGAIALRRVYDDVPATGRAFLVERLWPRGITRERLSSAQWCKEVAPSHELRKWFGHDPQRWDEFRRRYAVELDDHAEAWRPLVDAAAVDDITLLYSSRDTEHNNAVALRDYLTAQTARQ
jgi:uncharacterized protein YeaO (DUF488 family)